MSTVGIIERYNTGTLCLVSEKMEVQHFSYPLLFLFILKIYIIQFVNQIIKKSIFVINLA